MGSYFKSLRRKIGVVTLVLACVFMAGWLQSFRVDYLVEYRQHMLISIDGGLVWERPVRQPSVQSHDFHFLSRDLKKFPFLAAPFTAPTPDDKWRWSCAGFVIAEYEVAVTTAAGTVSLETNRFYRVPYWSITVSLTLISALLLLSKPRANYPPQNQRWRNENVPSA